MKLKNKLQSKHIYIAFLFISFFLALLFCIFILNLKYFSNDFKGKKDINLTINEIDRLLTMYYDKYTGLYLDSKEFMKKMHI